MNEAERARAIMRAKERKQTSWYKLVPDKENTFRTLPTPASASTPANWYEYPVHREVGPDKKEVRCGKNAKGEGRCWMCDKLIPRLQNEGRDKRAQALQSQLKFVVQVAAIDEDTGKMAGPLVWTPSKKVSDQLLTSIFGSSRHDYTDFKKGRNLTIYRTGSGFKDTTYGAIQPDDEPTAVPKDIIKRIKPFSELKEIPVYSEATQKAAYQGIDLKDEERDMPKESKKNVSASKKRVVEEDDEDEDVEDTDDDETEDDEDEEPGDDEEAPEDEDETEDEVEEEDEEEPEEDDEDEEEDEPPVKKKKTVVKASAPPVKTKKTVVVEEDDDDEEEPEEEDDGDDEEDEPEPPKKKKVAAPPAKAVKKKIVTDEEEDDEEDEDEEPTPKKPVKKAVKAAAPVEDDEDDEDDEEEEVPVVKKKLVKRK